MRSARRRLAIPALLSLVAFAPIAVRADGPPPSSATGATATPVAAPTAAPSCGPVPFVDRCRQPGIAAISDLNQCLPTLRDLRMRHGAESVLFVVDIDNTLLTMTTDLGSDAWYTWQDFQNNGCKPPGPSSPACATFEEKGVDYDLALDPKCDGDAIPGLSLPAIQGQLYRLGSMRLTQDDAPGFVETIRRRGFPTVILTSRGPSNLDVTRREFCRNGLDFHGMAPGCPEDSRPCAFRWTDAEIKTVLNPCEIECLDAAKMTGRDCLWQDGLYMTSGSNKGAALRMLIDRLRLNVSAIVFVDDTYKHHLAMRRAFASTGVGVHTFWYTRMHDAVRAFNAGDKSAVKAAWNAVKDSLPAIGRLFPAPEVPACK